MKSPIKWVGGKRTEIKYFEKYIPQFETYVEPFVGGGALFWNLMPEKAIINDINEDLINFYNVLATKKHELLQILNSYVNTREFYSMIVNKLNNGDYKNNIEQAAIFYYINKTCFSGKWRVNSSGKFNNTYGSYKNNSFQTIAEDCEKVLETTEIYNEDFKIIFDKVQFNKETFVFLDPPYLDCDAMYTADQKFDDIYKYIVYFMNYTNCKVMLVVKSNDYLEKLFNNRIVDRYRINYRHNSTSKKMYDHLIITNY
ncbi:MULTISPECIES: DNA adenine methylase [Paenibacillus]|uniref:DNA adenine methylase n=1 Tax=Paenibacillus TaxID=44249 RepID=UPI0015C506D7|nr:Dam family site-specific DNA-(adenine-N6)-methyltransferase [Paenibacillus amylolyticus]